MRARTLHTTNVNLWRKKRGKNPAFLFVGALSFAAKKAGVKTVWQILGIFQALQIFQEEVLT